MADCAAPGCDRPTPDTAYVCPASQRWLAGQLDHAADLWPDLLDTASGQARMAEPGPRPRGRAPAAPVRPGGDPAEDHRPAGPLVLPFSWQAAQVREDVRNTATTWARLVAEQRGTILPIGRTPTVLRWLAGQLGWCRYQPWAGECWDELGYAAGLVERAVDRPADRRWLGVCGAPDGLAGACPGQLHARPGASTTRCPECGTGHDVAERRRWLDGMVRERAYTAAEIGAAYEHVPASTIRRWASEGRIVAHGHDKWGRPLYPLAEVLALAARPHRRRQLA